MTGSNQELKQKEAAKASGDTEGFSRSGMSGLLFVGCLLLGLAAGLLASNVVVGLIGGLGVGFIAMAAVRYGTGTW